MIRVPCACGEVYHADEAHIGRYIQCRKCGNVLYIADPAKPHEISRTVEQKMSEQRKPERADNRSRGKSGRRSSLQRQYYRALAVLGLVAAVVVVMVWARPNQSPTTFHSESTGPVSTPAHTVAQPLPPQSQLAQPVPVVEVEAPPLSLANGTNIVRRCATGGHGCLTVDNGTSQDAAVKLVSGGETVRFVYVRAGHIIVIKDIASGSYDLLFASGVDWDRKTHRFNREKSFTKFDDPLGFYEERTTTGVQFATFKVTLHPVSSGNAQTSDVDESEFEATDRSEPMPMEKL